MFTDDDTLQVSIGEGRFLRRLQLSDADDLYKLTINNFDRLRKWLPWVSRDYSRSDTDAFIRKSDSEWERDRVFQAGLWEDGHLAGCVGFRDFREIDRSAALGYWI